MNKILIPSLILFFCIKLFAQNEVNKMPFSDAVKSPVFVGQNPHDSLLFDGSSEVILNKQGDKKCKWKVKHVWGRVIGTRDTIKHNVYKECDWRKKEGVGEYKDQIRGQMRDGDEVYDNDSLKMDDNSLIQIEMTYGGDPVGPHPILILTAMCKKFIVPCGKGEIKMDFDDGKYFWESTDYYLMYVGSQRCLIKNDGTKYSLETNENDDIIKVYEGSVQVIPKKFESNAREEMTKLTEDYQNGKISLEEYMNKSKELTEKMGKETNNFTMNAVVQAGQQIIVGKVLGEVIPISVDDNKWWDNQNFNK